MPTMATRSVGGAGAGEAQAWSSEPSNASTIRCALFPPKPKALTPRGAGRPGLGLAQQTERRAGERVDRSSAWSVGGRRRCSIAPSTFMSPATPAGVIRWPRFDFSEPIGRRRALEHAAMLRTSVASPTTRAGGVALDERDVAG